MSISLDAPLLFRPVYKVVLWGGRRLERWRSDLPSGPVGESWDLADHDSGMSVVEGGPLAGLTLRELVARDGPALVGRGFMGDTFPILIKLIDATDKLSVQVHPDDAVARSLGVGSNGKTECWLVLDDGGELYQGTKPGVDRGAFERALVEERVAETLNRYETKKDDFFFMAARTVHALGAGCMVYELQQTLDITFRVYDWGRVGADGKPRPMHVRQALETIDFGGAGFGPRRPPWQDTAGGRVRTLIESAYFDLEEYDLLEDATIDASLNETCAAITCLSGRGALSTTGGHAELVPGRTALVPAAAGRFQLTAGAPMRVLVAAPRF
jgi:mannose-6-phosphate isomerase